MTSNKRIFLEGIGDPCTPSKKEDIENLMHFMTSKNTVWELAKIPKTMYYIPAQSVTKEDIKEIFTDWNGKINDIK